MKISLESDFTAIFDFVFHFKITNILIQCQLCQYSGFNGYQHFCPYYQAII